MYHQSQPSHLDHNCESSEQTKRQCLEPEVRLTLQALKGSVADLCCSWITGCLGTLIRSEKNSQWVIMEIWMRYVLKYVEERIKKLNGM